MTRLQGMYEYAKRNGYPYGFDCYVAGQYAAYCNSCVRCGVEPKTRSQWVESQG